MLSLSAKKFFSTAEWAVLVALLVILVAVWLTRYSPWSVAVDEFLAKLQIVVTPSGLLSLPVANNLPYGAPPFTNIIGEQLAASHGFQYLVSYTAKGFEPATVSIKKGQTVRFTNNTPNALWVVASGKAFYPAVSGDCGVSAFDSCATIGPGAFWEFTFSSSGNWNYENKLNPNSTGIVRVQ